MSLLHRWFWFALGCLLIFQGDPLKAATLPSTISAQSQSTPVLEGCPLFPADNVWNTPIQTLPPDPSSSIYIQSIGASDTFYADFGSGIWPDPGGYPIGIPYNVVTNSQVKVSVDFYYPDESDPGLYPIPDNPMIEGDPNSGDRHILILDKDNCILYELYDAWKDANGWHAGSGAIYTLSSNILRTAGWTSADAAGLPILPGLVRYEEVATGEITHAIRFTVNQTRRAYVWPARHYASSLTGAQYPPMGQRFRLKAGFDISSYGPQTQVVLKAMKKYGLILADNGSDWYLSGVPNANWDNNDLHSLRNLPGSAIEAVDSSWLMVNPNSGQAVLPDFHNVFLALVRK